MIQIGTSGYEMGTDGRFTLSDLNTIIKARASADDKNSYTASLLAKGTAKCAEKLGEEAVEAVIAAVTEDRDGLVKESADVLFHLLVLLQASNVDLEAVMEELQSRTAQSGLQEKASRNKN